MKLSHIAARNILRNRRRSLLSGIAIAIAAMVIVFMFSLIEGMKADMKDTLVKYETGEVRIRNSGFDENEQLNPLGFAVDGARELSDRIAAEPYVAAVSPRIRFATAIYEKDSTFPAVGVGMDFEREKSYQDLGTVVTEGRLPRNGTSEVLLGRGLAADMSVSVGDRITLFTATAGRGSNAMTFTVSGVASFDVPGLNKRYFMAPLDRVQRLLRMEDAATDILVRLDSGASPKKAEAALDGLLAGTQRTELEASFWKDIGQVYMFIELAQTSYQFIALFFFVLASTVIINTTIMVIYERIREIGTVAALGMQGGEIVRMFFLEAFFIAVLGSLAGVLVGMAITGAVSVAGLDFSAAMEGVSIDIPPILRPVLNLYSTVFVFIYSVAIASLASVLPSRRASKIEPVEALRSV